MLSKEEIKFVQNTRETYKEFITLFEQDYLNALNEKSQRHIVIVYERAADMIKLDDEHIYLQIKDNEGEQILLEFTEVMIKYKILIQNTKK